MSILGMSIRLLFSFFHPFTSCFTFSNHVARRTDHLIQETIRDKFAKCTVLTVAHRLHTIIDSDRVLVMDAGEVIEFDEAHTLLQMEKGVFCGMVKSLGREEFKRFVQISCQKHSQHRGGEYHPLCVWNCSECASSQFDLLTNMYPAAYVHLP